MAPTTPGNSRHRQRELRVAKNSEGAQAQGGPLSNNTDRNSIVRVMLYFSVCQHIMKLKMLFLF